MSSCGLRAVKPEIRVLGVDDGKFAFRSGGQALVVGVVIRAGTWLEGVMSTHVTVDGVDATESIAHMVQTSPYRRQLRVIMLNGVTFGGFNTVDIQALHAQTGLPVITAVDRKPNLNRVHDALRNLPETGRRWQAIQAAGELYEVVTRNGKKPIYVGLAGVTLTVAIQILQLTATRSRIPEPLRVAHLVASGISLYTP